MSQVEFQKTIFNIYTDEAFRQEFLASPKIVLARSNLTDKETKALLDLPRERLDAFSHSLFEKKKRVLKKIFKFSPELIIGFSAYTDGPALFIQSLDKPKKYSISMQQFEIIKNFSELSLNLKNLLKTYVYSSGVGFFDLLKISLLINREGLWNRKVKIL